MLSALTTHFLRSASPLLYDRVQCDAPSLCESEEQMLCEHCIRHSPGSLGWPRLQDARVAVRRRCEDCDPVALQPARLALPHLQRGVRLYPLQCTKQLTRLATLAHCQGSAFCNSLRTAFTKHVRRCRCEVLGLVSAPPALVLQVWTGVETQDVAVLKLRKSGGAPARMVVVRFFCHYSSFQCP